MVTGTVNVQKPVGWLRRNLKWVLPVAIICGILIFISMLFLIIMSIMRSSDAYQTGLLAAKNNAQLIELIGEPIESGWFITGSVQISGSSGSADILIPISGPKGSGTVHVVGEKKLDVWRFIRINFQDDSGYKYIDLN